MEFLPPAFAGCGLVLGWMGSPLFFYQTIDVVMAHNVMFFAMTGAYYYTYRLRRRPEELRLWFLVGFLSAFVILARYQGAIMLLFPGIVCLQEVFKNFRHASGLIVAIVAGAIPLSLQMIAWKIMYGSFFLYTYQGETFNWAHPHLWEVLFSPFHGLFNWHPMMLIGFLGFVAWAVQSRRYTEAVCFTVSLLLSIYVNASWNNWWFGGSFGSRAFETCTLFSMLGIGFLLSLLVRQAAVFHTAAFALLVLAVWNMNMMYLSENGLLPFEKPETWRQRFIMTEQYWSHAFDTPTGPKST
jgi:4-amino-4-deoxy-L-arabinose transferase-like glycosyltransferase